MILRRRILVKLRHRRNRTGSFFSFILLFLLLGFGRLIFPVYIRVYIFIYLSISLFIYFFFPDYGISFDFKLVDIYVHYDLSLHLYIRYRIIGIMAHSFIEYNNANKYTGSCKWKG